MMRIRREPSGFLHLLRQIIRYVGSLYALQIVLAGLVFLLVDIRWLSILVGLLFLVLVGVAGRSLAGDLDGDRRPLTFGRRTAHGLTALVIGLLWQVPGLLATVRFVQEEMGLVEYDGLSDLMDFLAETWHMALMPLLAAIPPGSVDGYHARYYFALLATSPALILLLVVASLTVRRR